MKLLLVAITASAIVAQTTVTYSYDGLPLPVLTDAADTITVANVFVPREIKMTKVIVQVQIQYPNSGDLNVYLFSPSGTRTILLEHDCAVANIDTTFDDSAPSQWKDFCPVEAGRGPFRPDQPLSNFNADDSSFGTWQLAVENNQSDSRSGWITGVSITITGAALASPVIRPTTVTNAANVRNSGNIAPGELVSVYGLALGPDQAVSAPSGNLPTSLSGSSVTINGTSAPIAYTSLYRIDFQAPFNLTGSTATLQVTSGTQSSAPIQVNVVTAAPAVFTRSVDGTGQVIAVNQNGSSNSNSNPAAKGNMISLYASGLGAASPAIPAGTAPPNTPLSSVSGVTATIGGISAAVQFAGLAPGLPGLYQLNIQVPTNAASGAEELIVSVAAQSSQRGAVIQVQ